jgi:hypothetical protein
MRRLAETQRDGVRQDGAALTEQLTFIDLPDLAAHSGVNGRHDLRLNTQRIAPHIFITI